MKKTLRRAAALLVAAVMIMALTAVFVLPAAADGWVRYSEKDSYAAQTEYAISTKEDWIALTNANENFNGVTFHFTNDVDMENTPMLPVGYTGQKYFGGTINGHDYVLKNISITITGTANYYVGLIARVYGGTITHLGIESGNITVADIGDLGIGGFVGWFNGTLSYCWNGATVTYNGTTARHVAGLVGRYQYATYNGIIDNCYNIGTVNCPNSAAATAFMSLAYFSGSIQSKFYNSFNAGTLVGSTQRHLIRCAGSGNYQPIVMNVWDASGTADMIAGNQGSVQLNTNVSNSGILTAADYANGKLAWTLNTNYVSGNGTQPYYTMDNGKTVFGTAANQTRKVTVQRDNYADAVAYWNAGSVQDLAALYPGYDFTVSSGNSTLSGTDLTVGTTDSVIVGTPTVLDLGPVTAITTKYSAYDMTLFTAESQTAVAAVVAQAEAILADSTLQTQANVDAVVAADGAITLALNNTYPTLIPYSQAATYASLSPSKYAIGTKADWLALTGVDNSFSGVEFHFTNDVDMESTAMNAVANGSNSFAGTIDGHNYVLRNISITGTLTTKHIALIRELTGTVQNLGATGAITVDSATSVDSYSVGTFAGWCHGTVMNCWSDVDITVTYVSGVTSPCVGGIVGRTQSAPCTIINCYNLGDITGTGIVHVAAINDWCHQTGAKIYNCFNFGTLSGASQTNMIRFGGGGSTVVPDAYNLIDASGTVMAVYSRNGTNIAAADGQKLAPASYANGELAWTLNSVYEADTTKGPAPYYTVVNNKTVFGTAANQTRRLTVVRAGFADQYVYASEGTAYDLDIGQAATYAVTSGAGSVSGTEYTFGAGDGVATITVAGADIALVTAIRDQFAAYDTTLFNNGAAITAIVTQANAILANPGNYVKADSDALNAAAAGFTADLVNTYPDLVPYAEKDTVYAGIATTKYAIGTKADWLAVTNAAGNFAGIELHFTADIDMEDTAMNPVAYYSTFNGTINGHDHVLQNILISRELRSNTDNAPVALVAKLAAGGVITHLGIESGTVSVVYDVTADHHGVAGFAGWNAGDISWCWNAADVTVTVERVFDYAWNASVSGIAARSSADSGSIVNCYNLGTITAPVAAGVTPHAAGINDWTYNISIYNCFNAGVLVSASRPTNTRTVRVGGTKTPELYNIVEAGTGYEVANSGTNATTVKLDAASYANGELAWTLNANYDPAKGENPYYSVVGGKTVFGTAATVPHKVTFMLGQVEYAASYTDSTGYLITAAPSSVPARTLTGWEDALGNPVDPTGTFAADTVLYAVVSAPADTASASLTDTVEMNMNLDLDFYDKEVVSVTVTGPDANGENGAAPISAEYVKGADIVPAADGRYLIDWPVAAAQITDEITVTVTYSDSTTEEILTGYSVKAYLEAVKAIAVANTNVLLENVCDAALQYGACAQKAFDYKADALATAITTTASDWTPGDAEYNNVVTGTRAAAGLTKVSTSALIRDKVALRMYITLDAGSDIADYTVTYTKAGGAPVEITPVATTEAGKYSLDITGIVAAEFGTNYTFSVNNDALGTAYTLQTSVLNYGKKLLGSEGYLNLKTLVCAMKAYCDAAVAYFA